VSNSIPENGDSAELEALFDSIVMANRAQPPSPEPAAQPEEIRAKEDRRPTANDDAHKAEAGAEESIFSQIGHLTRKLHDTLRELGYDKALEKAVETMPDTRDRLAYIAVMTEQAAVRALTAIEAAQPLQEKLESRAATLAGQWQALYDNRLSVEEFKQLAKETRDYLSEVPSHTKQTNAQLLEIMMAQDFQDLTGQVIKKVIDMAQQMEKELLQLLLAATPSEKRTDMDAGLLNGPVINAGGRSDVVTSQEQVDELLESLGF
jgi:chemotaxis protein CheZ